MSNTDTPTANMRSTRLLAASTLAGGVLAAAMAFNQPILQIIGLVAAAVASVNYSKLAPGTHAPGRLMVRCGLALCVISLFTSAILAAGVLSAHT